MLLCTLLVGIPASYGVLRCVNGRENPLGVRGNVLPRPVGVPTGVPACGEINLKLQLTPRVTYINAVRREVYQFRSHLSLIIACRTLIFTCLVRDVLEGLDHRGHALGSCLCATQVVRSPVRPQASSFFPCGRLNYSCAERGWRRLG